MFDRKNILTAVILIGSSVSTIAQAGDYQFNNNLNIPASQKWDTALSINNNGNVGGQVSNSGNSGFIDNTLVPGYTNPDTNISPNSVTGLNDNGAFVQQVMNNDGVYTSPQNVLSGAEGYYYSSPNATPVVIQDQLSGFQFANGSYSSYVTGLSNTGEVAGYAQAPDATNKVFEYNVNTGTYTTLDTTALIAAGADPRTIETGGISSNGQYIAINYANAISGDEYGSIYDTVHNRWVSLMGNTSLELAASAGFGGTFITGVNKNGEAVGWSYTAYGISSFVLQTATGHLMQNISDFSAVPGSTVVTGVNDNGMLVGYAGNRAGGNLNFEATVPVPGVLWLMLAALPGLRWFRVQQA